MRSITLRILSALLASLTLGADAAPSSDDKRDTITFETPLVVQFRFDYADYHRSKGTFDNIDGVDNYIYQDPLWIPTLGEPSPEEDKLEVEADAAEKQAVEESLAFRREEYNSLGIKAADVSPGMIQSYESVLSFYFLGHMVFSGPRVEPRKFSWAPEQKLTPRQVCTHAGITLTPVLHQCQWRSAP